jgi:hypothetical protein
VSMRRRDVLLFRVAPAGGRIADLSCRQLYLRTVDAQCGASAEDAGAHEQWMGEPPLVRDRETPQQLIRNLGRTLQECRVLRVVDAEWLTADLRDGVDALVEGVRARGGEVLFERSTE